MKPIPFLQRVSLLSCLFLMVGSICLYGQQDELDSLKAILASEPDDETTLSTLVSLSSKLYRADPDEGIRYATQAEELAIQMDDKKTLALALKNIGLGYYFKSNFNEAVIHWNESLDYYKEIEDVTGISNLLSNLGAVYESQADYSTALEYGVEGLRYARQAGDQLRIATSLINIATIYAEDEKTRPQARETLEEAINISQGLNAPDLTGTAAFNLGELLLNEGQAKEALPYFEKALSDFSAIGIGHTSTPLNYMSKAYVVLGDYQKALDYADQSYDAAVEADSKIEMAQAALSTGDIYQFLNLPNYAIKAYSGAEAISKELNTNKELAEAYDGLAEVYAGIGSYRSAFDYQNQYKEISEQIRSAEYDEIVNKLRFQLDLETKEKEIEILSRDNALKEAEITRAGMIQRFLISLGVLLLLIIGGVSYFYRIIREERNRFEKILLNILPQDTADELQAKGYVEAKKFDQTTVLFTDFKGFTSMSESLSPEEIVKSIDYYFSKFDEIIGRYNLEKIKTIGDAYMCAGGLPVKNQTNAKDAVLAGLEILSFVKEVAANPPSGIHPLEVRIGINTGSIVAGVVGTKKFQYDIWGNTVNVASRMESACETGKINISDRTYELIKDEFACTYRGEVEVKNGLKLKMYYVDNEEYKEFKHNFDFTKKNILN